MVLPPEATVTMWVGAPVFWAMSMRHSDPASRGHALWVEGCEPIGAGLISGAALMGIGNAILEVPIG